jgi:predicted extracellular nuclease
MENRESCGPFTIEAGTKDEEGDGVAALRHAIGQGKRLAFCSANAERGEHVDYPHSTGTYQEDRVE